MSLNKINRFKEFKKFLVTKFIFLNGIISIIVLGLILTFLVYNSFKFFASYPIFDFLGGK